jgi:N-acetylglucosaminyl-diphospho-decaprenol L-rhamnosyltransferase
VAVVIREISAIVVSWRDTPETLGAVEALARARSAPESPAASLLVVDNAGGLPADELRRLWPDVSLIVNPENRGFGPAANQAASAARGDALLFLNPDARPEAGAFAALARAFDENPRAAAVAPRLVESDGSTPPTGPLVLAPPGREDQATFQLRRLPSLARDAGELLLLDHAFPNRRGRRRNRYADEDRERPFRVEQAAAAALAVRRDAFVHVGGFDERLVPAWHEDVELCARLAAEGEILYWPAARVRHRGGESASRLGYAAFLPVFYRNALRYRGRRYGAASRVAYRGLLAAGMLLRLALLPIRRDVPRPRAEAARAYGRVLAVAAGLS